MDIAWEVLHDPTVREIAAWLGAIAVVGLWIFFARAMVAARVKQFKREQAEREARDRAAETDEAPKE
ncbi:hypothetical protein [Methylocapsa acidiphila]|uniref:hypothetical protein n=1 Tax=Methylocapsa acidiphila TaxID=133552 RepID=UPI00040C9389|nr:hypothetical protein [Methylocapsa acidiphila]